MNFRLLPLLLLASWVVLGQQPEVRMLPAHTNMAGVLLSPDMPTARSLLGVTGSTNVVGYISPLDYGAVGDGVTDDTTAVSDASAAAAAVGKVLYFHPGTYAVVAPLVLAAPVVQFELGAKLLITGANPTNTVAMNRIIAPPSQIFSSTLAYPVRLEADEQDELYWEWWGAVAVPARTTTTASDSTLALNQAFAAFQGTYYPAPGNLQPGHAVASVWRPQGFYGLTNSVTMVSHNTRILGKNPSVDGTGLLWVGLTNDAANVGKALLLITNGVDITIEGMAFIGPANTDTNYSLGAAIWWVSEFTGTSIAGKKLKVRRCQFGGNGAGWITANTVANFEAGIRVSGDNGNSDFGEIVDSSFVWTTTGYYNNIQQSVNWVFDNLLFSSVENGIWFHTDGSSFTVKRAYFNRFDNAFRFGGSTINGGNHRASMSFVGGERVRRDTTRDTDSTFLFFESNNAAPRVDISHYELSLTPDDIDSTNQNFYVIRAGTGFSPSISFRDGQFSSGGGETNSIYTTASTAVCKASYVFDNMGGLSKLRLNFPSTSSSQQVDVRGCGYGFGSYAVDALPISFSRTLYSAMLGVTPPDYYWLGDLKDLQTDIRNKTIQFGSTWVNQNPKITTRHYTITFPMTNVWEWCASSILPTNATILTVSAQLIGSNPLVSGANTSAIDVGTRNNPGCFGFVLGASPTTATWVGANGSPFFIGKTATTNDTDIVFRGRIDVRGKTFSKTGVNRVTSSSAVFGPALVGDEIEFASAYPGVRFAITNYVSTTAVDIDTADATTFAAVPGTVYEPIDADYSTPALRLVIVAMDHGEVTYSASTPDSANYYTNWTAVGDTTLRSVTYPAAQRGSDVVVGDLNISLSSSGTNRAYLYGLTNSTVTVVGQTDSAGNSGPVSKHLGTLAAAPATAVVGDTYYDSVLATPRMYSSASWKSINTARWDVAAEQAITAVGNTIDASSGVALLNPDANHTLTSTPTILDGVIGQRLVLMVGSSEANTVTIQDESILASSNFRLSSGTTVTVSKWAPQEFIFDGAVWVQLNGDGTP